MAPVQLNDALMEVFETVVVLAERGLPPDRVRTGFEALDEFCAGGIPRGGVLELHTAYRCLAVDFLLAMAVAHAKHGPTLVLASGRSENGLASHMLTAAAGVPPERFGRADLERAEWAHLAQAAGELSELPVELAALDSARDAVELVKEWLDRVGGEQSMLFALECDAALRAVQGGDAALERIPIVTCPSSPVPLNPRRAIFELELSEDGRGDVIGGLASNPWGESGIVHLMYDEDSRGFWGLEESAAHAQRVEDLFEEVVPRGGRELTEEPPPRAQLRHLTSEELASAMRHASERATALGEPDLQREIAIFLAVLLPRFKWAHHKGHPSTSIERKWLNEAAALTHGELRGRDAEELLKLSGAITRITSGGLFQGKPRAASYQLEPGVCDFTAEAPKRSLHIRKPGDHTLEERWESLHEAARPSG